MSKFVEIEYKPNSHGSFEQEWGCHMGCNEWWYCTGYLNDEAGGLYSFQFTLIRLKPAIKPYVIMTALTDFQTGEHHYSQCATLDEKSIVIASSCLGFSGAILEKNCDSMLLSMAGDGYLLDLKLDYGKGAFWHCDNGKLQMGLPGDKETTLYYSYPNMPTSGILTLGGEDKKVCGKAWFDKQGGSYSILNTRCMWEWFSLRFFDDEEIMLFSFPQDAYIDGSYIKMDCSFERLNDYTIKPLDFTCVNGMRFSSRWELELPGKKEEHYFITPLSAGQLNLAYFELLAGIYNEAGEQRGMCFVELLPGVYNKRIDPLALFKKR